MAYDQTAADWQRNAEQARDRIAAVLADLDRVPAIFAPRAQTHDDDCWQIHTQCLMRQFGHEPQPNHHGTVNEVHDDHILIYFDNEDGPGQGQAAPYPPHEVRHLSEESTDA